MCDFYLIRAKLITIQANNLTKAMLLSNAIYVCPSVTEMCAGLGQAHSVSQQYAGLIGSIDKG